MQVREETEALLHLKREKEQPRTVESASESAFKPTIITSAPPPPGGPRHSVRGVDDGMVVDSTGGSGRRYSAGTPHSSGGRDDDDFLVHPSHRHDGVAQGAWSDDESEGPLAVEGLFVPHGGPPESDQPDHAEMVAHDEKEEVGHCVLVDNPTSLQTVLIFLSDWTKIMFRPRFQTFNILFLHPTSPSILYRSISTSPSIVYRSFC